ncbi:XRE family transcriptional regulator [Plasticicumulans sp.]|uniref:helix-turn-helix domain-containing protein n=1 Tax=Plasticicumulans sp. TaxID=2307179 RepID=UPI002B5B02AB|nr:XRE family transcriptional regulator [Plasticicumulans sp.]HND99370.1 XRE family transcriptional regulator [Plasticicumulans sp.]HNJ09566.1 XRE family transcriptional regulator [Plasticicumulans sp.]HNM45022.1 XRE family transcriptional regulator [Plasticicumulans sp.]
MTAEPLRPEATADAAGDPPSDDKTALAGRIGAQLRHLRLAHGLSLERLARHCGVSRAMLGQIELGRSMPTVAVLLKIAATFGVSLSAFVTGPGPGRARLLPAHAARTWHATDQRWLQRTLYPPELGRGLALYEIRLQPAAAGLPQRQTPGTRACLSVIAGCAELLLEEQSHLLGGGDTLEFAADQPHAWRNPGQGEAVLYLALIPA